MSKESVTALNIVWLHLYSVTEFLQILTTALSRLLPGMLLGKFDIFVLCLRLYCSLFGCFFFKINYFFLQSMIYVLFMVYVLDQFKVCFNLFTEFMQVSFKNNFSFDLRSGIS